MFNESGVMGNPKTAVKLAQEQFSPLTQEFEGIIPFIHDFLHFDQRTFLHSVCVASVATDLQSSLSKSLSDLPILSAEQITGLRYGALLHDIGKAGIEETQHESNRSLYPEENKEKFNVVSVKIADKHESIGASMIRILFRELPIQSDPLSRLTSLIENHHKKPNDFVPHDKNKPFDLLPEMDAVQAYLHILLVASDVTTAMSESRGYHQAGRPCAQHEIVKELKNEITPHLIQTMFGKSELTHTKIEHIQSGIIKSALKSAHAIRHLTKTNNHNLDSLAIGEVTLENNQGRGEHLAALIIQARSALGMSTSQKM